MIGREAGKSFAYLVGVYLGDGCVTRQGGKMVFKLNTIDEDFALAVKDAIEDVNGGQAKIYKHDVSKSSKPNYALWCGNQMFAMRLELLGNHKLALPDGIEEMPLDHKKAFIVGLMDSEGFVAEKTNHKTGRAYYIGFKSCDPWVVDLVRLMQSVGLKIGKVSKCPPYKDGHKTPTRFHIKMQSWVDAGMRFNIKRKQDRVDRWASTVPYSERKLYPRKLTSETSTPEARQG